MVNITPEIIQNTRLDTGESIAQLSQDQPVMLVFLRHFGCTFCREALHTLSKIRKDIADTGTQLVLVHLSDPDTAAEFFSRYDLQDLPSISDPEARLYQTYGLAKGNFNQLFGLRVLLRTFDSAVIKGHGGWATIGDGFQMPGVFVIHQGQLKEKFIHQYISDKPDYIGMAQV